jgi:hypothetical protein
VIRGPFTARPPSNLVYTIGVDIDPAAPRRGHSAEARSMRTRYLFDTTMLEPVPASSNEVAGR